VASFVVGGAGAALLLAALGTGVAAQLAYNDLSAKCDVNMVCNANDKKLVDEQHLGRALTITTDVLLGVGGAALVTGVVLFIVELRRPTPARAWLTPAPGGLAVRF
jgi:hypothetical protein